VIEYFVSSTSDIAEAATVAIFSGELRQVKWARLVAQLLWTTAVTRGRLKKGEAIRWSSAHT